MPKDEPVKPETNDPIKEAIDHPDGPDLQEMIYGKEDKEGSYSSTHEQINETDDNEGDND